MKRFSELLRASATVIGRPRGDRFQYLGALAP
jgi:hypothetical protein